MIRSCVLAAAIVSTLCAETVEEKLRYVIDGDTAVFKTMTCRFAYVDTPESGNNPKARRDAAKFNLPLDDIYDAGRMAKRYTKSRLQKGRSYRIDIKKGMTYNRNICVIYLEDGSSLNERLVRDGFAAPFWRYIPKRMRSHFRRLAMKAKRENRGLWRIYPEVIRKMEMSTP